MDSLDDGNAACQLRQTVVCLYFFSISMIFLVLVFLRENAEPSIKIKLSINKPSCAREWAYHNERE